MIGVVELVTPDLEGTTVNVEPCHHWAHVEMARMLGVKLDLEDMEAVLRISEHFIGGPTIEIVREILRAAGRRDITDALVQEHLRIDKEFYKKSLENAIIEPRLGFLSFLRKVEGLNLPVIFGSVTPEAEAIVLIERSGLGKLFGRDKFVLGEDVARPKPDPAVFLETARRAGVDPKNQMVLEDSHNGVKAARAAGSWAIGMPVYWKGATVSMLVDAGAEAIFSHWNQVDPKTLITSHCGS